MSVGLPTRGCCKTPMMCKRTAKSHRVQVHSPAHKEAARHCSVGSCLRSGRSSRKSSTSDNSATKGIEHACSRRGRELTLSTKLPHVSVKPMERIHTEKKQKGCSCSSRKNTATMAMPPPTVMMLLNMTDMALMAGCCQQTSTVTLRCWGKRTAHLPHEARTEAPEAGRGSPRRYRRWFAWLAPASGARAACQ